MIRLFYLLWTPVISNQLL